MDGALGTFSVPLSAATALEGFPELVLLAVKTQDVESTLRANRPLLERVPVVTMQNGVQSDAIAAGILPTEHLLSAVVVVTATYLTPGHVTIAERGYLVLGRASGPRDELVAKVAGILSPAVPTPVSDHMVGAHWLKLLMNLNNAVLALTNLSLQEVTRSPFLRRLSVKLMREGLAVSDASGIDLAPLDGVSVGAIRMLTRLPTPLAGRFFAARAGSFAGPWPVLGSTLQSLRRGKPTEIDYLNGEVARRGRDLGIPTPLNTKVVELIHGIERTGRFYGPEEVRQALVRSAKP